MLNELAKECHEIAVEKGFYGNGYCTSCMKYNNCNSEYREDSGCCDLFEIKNRNIPELIMLVVTELSEAVEAHREGIFCDIGMIDVIRMGDNKIYCFEEVIKDTFEIEIADAFIRLLDLCGYLNIDIEKHIEAKIEYNKTRGYKHGKRY